MRKPGLLREIQRGLNFCVSNVGGGGALGEGGKARYIAVCPTPLAWPLKPRASPFSASFLALLLAILVFLPRLVIPGSSPMGRNVIFGRPASYSRFLRA